MELTKNECHLVLEWDLSCDEATAKNTIADALDMSLKPLIFGGGNIKGVVIKNKIYIWEAFPGTRGIPVARGVLIFSSLGNNSKLLANIKLPFLYRYIKPTTPKVALIVVLAVVSWLLTLTGALFEKYQSILLFSFPAGALLIVTLLLFLSRSFGDEQLSDLHHFLESTLGKYRQTPANQEAARRR